MPSLASHGGNTENAADQIYDCYQKEGNGLAVVRDAFPHLTHGPSINEMISVS